MANTYVYPFVKDQNGTYRPIIQIIITNSIDNVSTQPIWALLDTGADDCLFPQFIADITKHNLKGDGVESCVTQGVGKGNVHTWKHTFKIQLVSPDRKSIVWTSKPSLIGCLDHNDAPPLLGWSCFLSNFKITFNHPTKKIIIEIP